MSGVTEQFSKLNQMLVIMAAEAHTTPDYVDFMIQSALKEDDKSRSVARVVSARLSFFSSVLSHCASEAMLAVESNGATQQYELDQALEAVEVAQEKIKRMEAATGHKVHPISDATVRDAVWTLTQGRCAYCDKSIPRDSNGESQADRFCVEHVVPTSAGGPDNLANYVPACISCNSTKGDKHVLILLRRMQRRNELVVVSNNDKAAS